MSAFPQDYLNYLIANKDTVLAPWIAGCAVDLYAAGIYTGMVVRYFTRAAPMDNRTTTPLVVIVFILSTYKTAAALYILSLFSIVLNGNQVQLAVTSLTNWVMITSPLATQLVDLAVQSYYVVLLWDIFRIDRGRRRFHVAFRWFIFSAIGVFAILGVTMGCLGAAEALSFQFAHTPQYLFAQLAASFICDLLVSTGTIYCVLKSDIYSSKNPSVFTKIARLIALSASIPAIFALLNVSIVATDLFYNRWHILFDFALSKAFAISFMWTVEVRHNLRQSEVVERTSDAARKPSIRHQSSSNFLDSGFAHTVHMSRLANEQAEIELGYQRHKRQYDEHDKDQESSYDMKTPGGHSSAAGSLQISSDGYIAPPTRRVDLKSFTTRVHTLGDLESFP